MLVFACVLIMLVFPFSAFAMPAGEYENLLKSSPYFREMDENLEAGWKEATKNLGKKDKQWLLEIQREWLKFGRDEMAAEYMKQDYSKACAYALATKRQIIALRILAHNLSLSGVERQNAWPDDYYDDDLFQDLPAECDKNAPDAEKAAGNE